MTTNESIFPMWESKPIQISPAVLEYKFFMIDCDGNKIWEIGANREVDLTSFSGRNIIIEDDGFYVRSGPAKVYPVGNKLHGFGGQHNFVRTNVQSPSNAYIDDDEKPVPDEYSSEDSSALQQSAIKP